VVTGLGQTPHVRPPAERAIWGCPSLIFLAARLPTMSPADTPRRSTWCQAASATTWHWPQCLTTVPCGATGALTDLNDLLPAGSGWVLRTATGINEAGQIVGEGTLRGQRDGRAYLLTPPGVPTPPSAGGGGGARTPAPAVLVGVALFAALGCGVLASAARTRGDRRRAADPALSVRARGRPR